MALTLQAVRRLVKALALQFGLPPIDA